jgi:hypothetical protein
LFHYSFLFWTFHSTPPACSMFTILCGHNNS